MKTITEALKKILPAEHVNEVAKAVESMMAEQVKGLEKEFQAKLEEAYRGCKDTREREYDEVTKRIDRIDTRFWALVVMMAASLITTLGSMLMDLVKK